MVSLCTYRSVNAQRKFQGGAEANRKFVLRRHVCRERSNDTEALFAKLCGIDPKDPVRKTREAYRELCPKDEKFRSEFASANFSTNVIDRARYCLEQIELSKHGDYSELAVLGAEDVHVEHIIPQKIATKKSKEEFGDWTTYLGAKADSLHPKNVSRIGNLTLFAGALNTAQSNNPFLKKQAAYKQSSIKLTQELGKKRDFKFKDIDNRSDELSRIAIELWPMP